jgi:hypothetical protein
VALLHISAIKVRQAGQPDDEPPGFVRSRFSWNVQEVSSSLGDLGTFLPHIVGAITIVRMDPTGILTTFGLFYALSGAFYGVPMAVQPMKAASAAVLIEPMNPTAIAGAGLVIGVDSRRCVIRQRPGDSHVTRSVCAFVLSDSAYRTRHRAGRCSRFPQDPRP